MFRRSSLRVKMKLRLFEAACGALCSGHGNMSRVPAMVDSGFSAFWQCQVLIERRRNHQLPEVCFQGQASSFEVPY